MDCVVSLSVFEHFVDHLRILVASSITADTHEGELVNLDLLNFARTDSAHIQFINYS